jgi:hypothetical protein
MMKREEIPERSSTAVEYFGNEPFRVFQDGDLRWRYRGGKLITFIEYVAGYKYDGPSRGSPFVRFWRSG